MSKRKAGSIVLLTVLLAGCTYLFPLDLVVWNGKLLFWTEREYRWFLIPSRPLRKVCSIDVWTGRTWVWRVRSNEERTNCLSTPIAYGGPTGRLAVIVPPHRLKPAVRYDVRVEGDAMGYASFELTADRRLKTVGTFGQLDPDEAAEQDKRTARMRQLKRAGLSEEEATLQLAKEERAARAASR